MNKDFLYLDTKICIYVYRDDSEETRIWRKWRFWRSCKRFSFWRWWNISKRVWKRRFGGELCRYWNPETSYRVSEFYFIEFLIFIICISLTLTQSFRIVFIVFEFTVGLMNMKVTTSCTLSLITFTNSIEIEIKIFLPSILHMRQSTHKWTKSNLRKTDI